MGKLTVKTAKPAAPKKINPKILSALDRILVAELSGVTRNLHFSFMVKGPNRLPIVEYFRQQAQESLDHAVLIGEKITGLGGHPTLEVMPVEETDKHSVEELLFESRFYEEQTLNLYKSLVPLCTKDIALEEFVRNFVKMEQEHLESLDKMIGG